MRWLLLGALLLAGPAPAAGAELILSVAISLREAVAEVGRQFSEVHGDVRLRYNLGASGELAHQIEAGAPVDVFVAAAQRPMDELETRGLVVGATRRAVARTTLVVVQPAGASYDLGRPVDLLGPGVTRIAIGNPRTVPAGLYAEESLRGLGLWDRLRPRLVFAENVRHVLDWVARGEVDAGFVYATDVPRRAGRVVEAFRPAEDTYRPIVYPAAVVAGSRHPALARAFVERLGGPAGRAVLARWGFQPPPPR